MRAIAQVGCTNTGSICTESSHMRTYSFFVARLKSVQIEVVQMQFAAPPPNFLHPSPNPTHTPYAERHRQAEHPDRPTEAVHEPPSSLTGSIMQHDLGTPHRCELGFSGVQLK